MALASVTALVATMGLNAYSGALTIITALNSLFEVRPTPRLRIVTVLGLAAAWTAITFAITTNAIALLFATLSQGGLAVNALVPKQMVDVLQAVVIIAVATSVPEVRRLLRSVSRSVDR